MSSGTDIASEARLDSTNQAFTDLRARIHCRAGLMAQYSFEIQAHIDALEHSRAYGLCELLASFARGLDADVRELSALLTGAPEAGPA